MNFVHPWWLLVGILACAALLWVWRRHDARQRRALEQFVAPQLRAQLTQSISGARVLVKRICFAGSIALLFIALAGPQAGFRWEQVKRRGNDIIFAVDTSRSMLTPDVRPNRLARAKLAIDDFVNRLNGDAVGLVAFAGTAFLQTPITLDYGAFHESLAALDTHIIPRGGTNIAAAIHEAQAALQRRPGSDKILILVTDGEDLEGNALAAAKAAASQDGLKIFTVGVGSANGDLIPLPADQGGGFLKDGSGQLVKSRLDEPALKALAAATGGSYAPLGADNQGLDTIYQEALAPLAKHDLESRAQRVYTQRFQWPLGAALALLLASTMVGTRRRLAAARSTGADTVANTPSLSRLAIPASAAVLSLCWLLPVHSAHASPSSAAAAYKRGDYSSAERDYSAAAANDAKQPILQFDAGTAAYKAGEFPRAARAFRASVNASTSGGAQRLVDQEDAYYNLGNTLYREGQKTERDDPQTTIQNWTGALKAYDAALQLRTDDTDSKFNRDLVSRKLEALKKAQSQQKQTAQNQPQPSKPQSSKPQQGAQQGQQQGQKPDQGQQAKDNSSASKSQQQSEQSKQPFGGQPQEGKGPPEQAKQIPGGASPGKEQAQGDAGSQPGTMAQAGDDQRLPGEMSRQEARELLDSVKDEEHRPPAAPVARNGASDTSSDEPLKDW